MNWKEVINDWPPKKDNRYLVLVISSKVHKGGNYKGQGIRAVVQDWVVRQWPYNFTHWIEILPPK